jgi:Helix-turn-helix domain
MRDQGKTAVDETPAAPGSLPFGGARAAADLLLRPGQPLFYKIPEVMTMLRMSRSVAFDQLRAGRLGSVRQGRARRIPVGAILDYIDLLEREAAQ